MFKKVRLLLVEDDEDDMLLFREALRRIAGMHYMWEWAKTYDEGIAKIGRGKYDVVFLNYSLGAKNAIDFLSEPRCVRNAAKFVVISSLGENRMKDQAVDEALAAGASAWLDKNELDPVSLRQAIKLSLVSHMIN